MNKKKLIFITLILTMIFIVPSVANADSFSVSSGVDSSKFSQPKVNNKTTYSTYPSSYDLRNYGRVTSIKDQGEYGTCWSFAALASGESGLVSKYPWVDLSEKHLIDSTYGFKDSFRVRPGQMYLDGGFNQTSTATLSHFYGAENEGLYPYSNFSKKISSSQRLQSDFHLRDVSYLPSYPVNTGDDKVSSAILKKLLMKNGALSIAYNADFDTLNYKTSAWYNKKKSIANHQVTLIGWDDDYSKNNFLTKPKNNGAWLVKNSWGPSDEATFGGCFWISYEDKSMVDGAFYNMSDKSLGEKVQFYDNTGWSATISEDAKGPSGIKGGNKYKAKENTNLTAVGLYTVDSNINCKISVYTKLGSKWVTKLNNHFKFEPYAGYHTVTLPKSIPLKKGQEYFISYEADNTNHNKEDGLPFEKKTKEWVNTYSATIKSGESYLYDRENKKWIDVYKTKTLKNICNLCLNAITDTKKSDTNFQGTDRALLSSLMVGNSKVEAKNIKLFDLSKQKRVQDMPKIYTNLKTELEPGSKNAHIWLASTGNITVNGVDYTKDSGIYEPIMMTRLKNGDNIFNIKVSEDGRKTTEYKLNIIAKPIPEIGPVKVLKATDNKGKVVLRWSRAANEPEGYKVYRATSKNGKYTGYKWVKNGTAKTTTDTNVKKGKTYYYKVRAYLRVGDTFVWGGYSPVAKTTI
ncbi:MAG: C1 family peptidase [Anaerovoracaceae bacterium]